jgi:signal transduction histidine kinase
MYQAMLGTSRVQRVGSVLPFLRERALALACLIGVVGLIGWRVEVALVQEVQRVTEAANRSFTRLFVNENWEKIKPLLRLGATPDEISNNSGIDRVDGAIRRFARGTDLVRVKIFDARGYVVYATDRAQLGTLQADSAGFLSAVKGQVATQLVYRDDFSAFDGALQARDLVSSYVPVKGSNGVEAVVEVYTDRTDSIDAVRTHGWRVVAFVALLLSAVSAVMWVLFHRQRKRQQRLVETHQDLLEQQSRLSDERMQAESDKSDFLWNVTRALQRPTDRMVETLRHVSVPPGLDKLLASMTAATTEAVALQKRVADFRTLVELNAGEFQPRLAPFHLGDLLRRLGDTLVREAERRQLKAFLYVAQNVDGCFQGDARRLEDILGALIGNALQFTPSGSIQLRAQAVNGSVMFDVIDTGQGMNEATLQALFNVVNRITAFPTTTRILEDESASDLLLELIMARGLAQALGGELVVKSDVATGTWVTLHLPLQPSGEAGA